jgi:hypothetical protein
MMMVSKVPDNSVPAECVQVQRERRHHRALADAARRAHPDQQAHVAGQGRFREVGWSVVHQPAMMPARAGDAKFIPPRLRRDPLRGRRG